MLSEIRDKLASANKVLLVIQIEYHISDQVLACLEEFAPNLELSRDNWELNPETIWKAVGQIRKDFTSEKRPTAVHEFAQTIQEEGKLHRVFSLNWGHLERRVGIPKQSIVKVYGNFDRAICDRCCRLSTKQEFDTSFENESGPLGCREWECQRALLRPNLVFPGIRFSKDYLLQLISTVKQADLCILFIEDLQACQDEVLAIVARCSKQAPIFLISNDLLEAGNVFCWQMDPIQAAQQLLTVEEPQPSMKYLEWEPRNAGHGQCKCLIL
jgi:hypothetical protein